MRHADGPDRASHHSGHAEPIGASPMVDRPFGTSLDEFVQPAAHHDSMAFTSAEGKPSANAKNVHPLRIPDREEEKAVEKLLANENAMTIGLSALAISMLSLAAMLGVHMRRR